MNYRNLEEITLTDIPTISDTRGNLAVIEKECLPYPIKRVYYLFDVPSDSYRGGHAHKEQLEFLIALSGSFNVTLDNGSQKKSFLLNKPNKGLLLPTGIWRELEDFSSELSVWCCLLENLMKAIISEIIRILGT